MSESSEAEGGGDPNFNVMPLPSFFFAPSRRSPLGAQMALSAMKRQRQSLEERVRILDAQLAQLEDAGFPTKTNPNPGRVGLTSAEVAEVFRVLEANPSATRRDIVRALKALEGAPSVAVNSKYLTQLLGFFKTARLWTPIDGKTLKRQGGGDDDEEDDSSSSSSADAKRKRARKGPTATAAAAAATTAAAPAKAHKQTLSTAAAINKTNKTKK